MPLHPMFSAALVASHPDGDRIYKIQIAYPQGTWTFHDRTYSSEVEALSAVPELQATGQLPKDNELFA